MKQSLKKILLPLAAGSAMTLLAACAAPSPVQVDKNALSAHIRSEIASQNKRALVVVYEGWFVDAKMLRHSLRQVVRWDANGTWTEQEGSIDGKRYDVKQSVTGLLTSAFLNTLANGIDPEVRVQGRGWPLIAGATKNSIDVQPGAMRFSVKGANYIGTLVRIEFQNPPENSMTSTDATYNGVTSIDSTVVVSAQFPPYLYSATDTRQFKADAEQGRLPWTKHVFVADFHFE